MSEQALLAQPSSSGQEFEPSSSTGELDPIAIWTHTLDALELHLEQICAGVETGIMPTPYEVAIPALALPPALLGRALKVQAAQRDVEQLVRERLATLASVLRGAFAEGQPTPVFLDRRD